MKTELVQFGDLKPGDKIIGADGQPVTVTNVYEKHFPDKMYEIEMEDGEVVQASGNHLWYCESEQDFKFKDEYMRLAKVFFKNKTIPKKEEDEPFTTLNEMITLFGNEIDTNLFIEKVCRSLGYSRVGPHVIVKDKYIVKETVLLSPPLLLYNIEGHYYIGNKGYFFFGEVRTTEEIAQLMEKGVEINIPTRKEIE